MSVTSRLRLACFGFALSAAPWLVATAPVVAEWPTAGGDAGKTAHVTSLADSGPGTLRAALARKAALKIVFDVGGDIILATPLTISNSSMTIMGETAPSPGISILGDKLHVRASDVIIRHIRMRVGELPGSNPSARDGISIDLTRKGDPVSNILIDHCSVSWAIDENIGILGTGVSNVLVRNTIVAEGLRNSIHPKLHHSMGMLIGEGAQNVVVVNNLFAHNMFRNPVVDAGSSAVLMNNLIYDPGSAGFHIYAKPNAGPTLVSVVGNLLIAGPETSPNLLRSFDHGIDPDSQIYYADNQTIGAKAFSTAELGGKDETEPVPFVEAPPIWFPWLRPISGSDVERTILPDVGARPWDRDATDARIVANVEHRSGVIRDTPPDPRLAVPRPIPAAARLSPKAVKPESNGAEDGR